MCCCIGSTEEIYKKMLTAVSAKCDEMDITADPATVILDFELAAMNAVRSVFGDHVQLQGCFYHLTQSTWRHVQQIDGLVNAYKNNDTIKHFCGMLDGLAFLPADKVKEGMAYLRQSVPNCPETSAITDLLNYFDTTYVSGSVRQIRRPAGADNGRLTIRVRRVAPLFPPAVWNVHDETLLGGHRTNNLCESWNNGFRQLVGHSHPSLYALLEALQRDEAMAITAIIQDAHGQPPTKRIKRSTHQLQERLVTVCKALQDGQKSVPEGLQALGHVVRFTH